MSLEAVEKLMNETAEAVAYQKVGRFRLPHLRDVDWLEQEIDSVLISKMSVDEEEQVQRELAALQAEQVSLGGGNPDDHIHQPQLASTMPAVPETQLPERLREGPAAQEEEDEPGASHRFSVSSTNGFSSCTCHRAPACRDPCVTGRPLYCLTFAARFDWHRIDSHGFQPFTVLCRSERAALSDLKLATTEARGRSSCAWLYSIGRGQRARFRHALCRPAFFFSIDPS
jgi:hypothetical protein